MSVSYDSKKLIPAPFIQVTRDTLSREDGTKLGNVYNITVHGKLVAWKGSPDSSGSFWDQSGYPADEDIATDSRLTAILKKQEALRRLFNEDGRLFEVAGFDGFAPFKCNPRVKRVEIADGEGKGANWTEYCEYTITLEADFISGLTDDDAPDADGRVSKFDQQWNLELLDEHQPTYRLTRSISATGRRVFDETGALADGKQAWENARTYLLDVAVLGLHADRMASSGIINGDSLQAFNYTRTDSTNETAGVCSITESWLCFDPIGQPPAIHEQTITCRTGIQDGRTTVSVEGNIQGLEQRENNTPARAVLTTRYVNANGKWEGYVQPSLYTNAVAGLDGLVSGITLHPFPAQASVGRNQTAGTVNYQYEFDNRPVPLTANALSETITVNNSYPTDVYAQIPVLGRPIGPVLQSAGTVSVRKRSISIDIQMPAATTTTSLSAPSTGGIVLALMPGGTVFLDQDEESWTPTTGRYTRNTSFTFE